MLAEQMMSRTNRIDQSLNNQLDQLQNNILGVPSTTSPTGTNSPASTGSSQGTSSGYGQGTASGYSAGHQLRLHRQPLRRPSHRRRFRGHRPAVQQWRRLGRHATYKHVNDRSGVGQPNADSHPG